MARKEMMAITRRRLAQYLSKASFASNVDRQAALDCLEELGDAIDAAPSASAPECDTCNGFIHVHDATGEYRGECPHCATSASAQQAEPDEEDEESEGAIPPVHWDLFPGWLIDHHEGDTITEELLQHALADMLKVHPAAPARSASPICTCPSGDGSLRHPCPSHPGASPEPYNAYQRDWEKVVRWVKVQSETFPELASMSPEGAISWLVVELAARHEKFAEPSASPAALTDEQALDISIDLGMVRKDYGGYFVNKLTVEEIMEAIRSLCTESPAAPIAAETEPMAWLFVKSGKKMKIFVRAEASELLDGHYPLFGQSASQLKRHVPQANEQFIAPKLELLAASPAALTDAQIQEVLQKLAPAWWDVPQGATEAFARALLAASPADQVEDAVTREDVAQWARFADIPICSEEGYEKLADFAIAARRAMSATPPAAEGEPQ